MEPQIPPELTNSVDAFIKEVNQPTIPAMNEGGARPSGSSFNPPPPGNAPNPAPAAQPENTYTPPPGADFVFTREDTEPGQEPEEEAPKLSKDYGDKVIMGIINGEDYLTSTITAMVAGEDDITPFRSTDADKADLAMLLEPFREMILLKFPAWLPVVMVYATIKTKQIRTAAKHYKTNKANREATNNSDTVNQVHKAADQGTERTNFVLYIDGYYRNNRTGGYIKRPSQNHLREKPNINDLEKILAAKANRERDLLTKAFGWSDSDFSKHGIEV